MKGQNLRILLGSPAKCVAFSTSCTYHLSANLESNSTKDNTDGFQSQEVVGYAGDVSCEALYSTETDASGINGVEALDLLLAGAEVDVEFSPTTGTKNRTETGIKYSCKGIVNDISVSAPNRQNVTYSIQIQLNSKPVKSTTSSSNL